MSLTWSRFVQLIILPFLYFYCLAFLLLFSPSSLCIAKGFPKPLQKADKVTQTTSGQVDMCLSCHQERPDKAHGRQVLGCYVCHLGNPLAGTPGEAHKEMVKNPGELRVATRTCGQSGCHPKQVAWVEKSLMATNRGILSTLRYYWGETENQYEDITVNKVLIEGLKSPAVDYFRKLCATCHLGMEKGVLPGFLAKKGGGCTACHSIPDPQKGHVQILKAVPLENCVRCHNRSGRIGLSYQGKFESEGYGTPYQEGDLASMQLEDGRYYRPLPPDIHYEKGMVCIDCHTQKEVMGDGTYHAHMEQQVEIRCRTCHAGSSQIKKAVERQKALARLPEKRPIEVPDFVIQDGKVYLKGKIDKRLHPLSVPKKDQCGREVHRRLSCQACHSTWVPQCYGCHVQADSSKTQLDKLLMKDTLGSWKEFRSLIRYETPPLGVLGLSGEESGNTGESCEEQVVVLVPG